MAPLTRVGELPQVTEVIYTAASIVVFFLQSVASPACSKRFCQGAAVSFFGGHRCR